MQKFFTQNLKSKSFLRRVKTFAVLILTIMLSVTANATIYNVTNTTDGHAITQLRGAIEAADAAGGTHTINVAAGTYTLTLGQITFGNTAQNITIIGAGSSLTIISMTTGATKDRIFFINPTGVTNSPVITVQGIKFQNGYLTSDPYGGAAICAGGGSAESLTVTDCIFENNILPAGAYGGAAVCMQVRGNLSIDNCTFTNNVSNDADGGAVLFIIFGSTLGTGYGTLSVTNSTFTGNSVVFPGAPAANGGALAFSGQGGVTPFNATINNNTFISNTADGFGGGILANNSANVSIPQIHFNRFLNNTSAVSASSSGLHFVESSGSVNAENNWWGCNTNPVNLASTAPCNQAGGDAAGGGSLDVNPWLQLRTTASPNPICNTPAGLGNTTTVTTSFLNNSDGTAIPVANLSRLIGLPVTWGPTTLGTLSAQQTTIQASGTATATFTSNGTGGTATVNTEVDNVPVGETTPARASITVNTIPTVTSPANTTVCVGSTATFTSTITGTPTPSIQWRIGTTVLVDGLQTSGSTVSGATTATLTITNVQLGDASVNYNVQASNHCGTTTSADATLTVNPIPDAVATPSSQTICSGATITTIALTGSVNGTIYNWTRNNTGSVTGIAATGSGNISGALTNTTNAPVTVTFTITPSFTFNGVTCTGTPIAATVLVNPIPNVVATPSSQTICSGATITTIALTGNVSGTTFNWTRDNTGSITGIAANSSGDISGALTNTTNAPVTVTFTITPTANNCPGAPITATVLVNPTPNAVATPSSQTICSVLPMTTIALTGNVSGTIFNWTRDNTGSVTGISATGSGDIGGALTNTTNAPVTVTFTITPTANNCPGASITATVLVNPLPVVSAGADVEICAGGSTTLTATGAVTYVWNNGAGNTASVTVSPTTTTTYTVTGTDANGCVNTDQVTVTVTQPVNAGTDGSTSVCDNSTDEINLFSLITGEQAGGVWSRLTGTGGTFNAGAGTFTPAAGATTSTFQYLITGTSPCPDDASVATVTIISCTSDPVVTVAVSPASVTEDGATNLVYTFTRNTTSGVLTVNFTIGTGGNHAIFFTDYTHSGDATLYTPPTGQVTFINGSSTATITVDPISDTDVEPDETVILTLTSGSGYVVGTPNSATGTITNDDAAFNPCADITPLTCGIPVTSTHTGAGAWDVTTCGVTTPGREKIYSFTPAVTGSYTLQVTTSDGNNINYFYKAQSDGCDASDWICIGRTTGSITFSAVTLTAGIAYYILLESEITSSVSQTFQINCPAAPVCDISSVSISNASSCNNNGTPANGADDYFTADVTVNFTNPPATGSLEIELPGDVVAGGGATSVSVTGLTSPHTFTGVRFKADGTVTNINVRFTVENSCAKTATGPTVSSCVVDDPCAGITPLTCATPVTSTHTGAGAWDVTTCGVTTPGREKIYSFTPTVTGSYSLQVTTSDGNNINYFYKAQSDGCDASDWICIGRTTDPITFSAVTLTAGINYYILLESEITSSVSQTFQINCPAVPQFTAEAINITSPECPYASPSYIANGSFSIRVTDAIGCTGTYTVNAAPVANSGPGGSTPSLTIVTTYIGFGEGDFFFDYAGAGQYLVTITETDGGCILTTNPVQITVTVPDAASCPATASIGDRVWNDADGDGVQDGGETGLNGVTVELLNSSNAVIATTVTAANGIYGFSSLSAGSYSVRIVSSTLPSGLAPTYDLDGIGTPHIATFTLTVGQTRTDVDFGYILPSCGPVVNAPTVTQPTCGTSTGKIVVNATGSGTLQYRLNTGSWQTSNTFSGLAPGSYNISVRLKYNTGCVTNYSGNPVILSATGPTVNAPTVTQPTCAVPKGKIVVNATGSGTLEYRLNTGSWQTSNTFNNLAPGSYNISVRLKYNTGCFTNYSGNPVILNDATGCCVAPTVNAPTVTQPTCTVPTGKIVVNATGSGTLEYRLNTGSWQTSKTFIELAPGSYNISVRLQSNTTCVCSYSSNPVILNAATGCCVVPTVNAPTVTQPTCAVPTGKIVVNATGSGTLEYRLNTGSWQTSNTFNSLAAGSYNISVRLQSNTTCVCNYSNNPVILNAATGCCVVPTVNAPTVTQPTCAVPTGKIVVNATGSGTLEYRLNTGSWQTSNTFSSLAPGSYNISVRLQSNTTCVCNYTSNPVILNAATGCAPVTYKIFPSTSVPAIAAENDGQAIEVGVKFRVTQAGYITGIRFYKGTANTGTHIGHLWSKTGTKLAEATFTGETSSGWQQVLFTSPVAVTTNTTYVASYFSSAGYYALTNPYFTSAVVNGPLRALANGEDGGNGVYKYSTTSAFPNNTYQSSNYWVDVVFTTSISTRMMIPQQTSEEISPQKLIVKISPNPSENFFKLIVMSDDKAPVSVKISDISGRVLERYEKVAAGSLLQVGRALKGGAYIVEVRQGNKKEIVKVIKL